jgi:hypothetical protein
MFWFALFLLFGLALYLYISRKRPAQARPYLTATVKRFDPEQYKDREEERREWLEQHYKHADKWIYSTVVGVSHRNRSGSPSRQNILARCGPNEELQLIREADNPVDPNAIALYRNNGQQLGYLNTRLAEEMREWLSRGEQWHAILTEITGRDKGVLGANIALFRQAKSPHSNK